MEVTICPKKKFEPIKIDLVLENEKEVLSFIAALNATTSDLHKQLPDSLKRRFHVEYLDGMTQWDKVGNPLTQRMLNL